MMVSAACMFLSCSKDDDDNDNVKQPVEETRYYVKYEVSCSSLHNAKRTYSFSTEKGDQTVTSENHGSTKWEGTYGPVSKMFFAKFSCTIDEKEQDCTCHARIYVSREKEPFVIKAEGTGRKSLNISYQINF